MQAPARIKALDQNVVNKIAAGEIIVAPVNALKELIENAVDAGSTSIEIVVKDGGLKLLQITDNGSGINRDDMPILCERFTTSKLKVFEDLESISTYGFRGEALASISMIAHLTVTTKTKDSNCAWRAVYADGKLVPPKPGQSADPKPCAGRQGTQITVEDLFYNTPSRRRAFRSSSEEYTKILDVVGRYAVHCEGVAFSCKKHGESGVGVATTSSTNLVERIRRVHGSSVANEVIDFEVSNTGLGFKAKGMLSNANYHVKKTTLLLFINGRAVESSSIKKSIDAIYSTFLPKHGHPFVYLSIDIEPDRVDVNVHPTKREVNFLHEDEVIEIIAAGIQERLAAVDTSRSFALMQTLLPGALPQQQQQQATRRSGPANAGRQPTDPGVTSTPSARQAKKPYENNTVRVDHRDQKITAFVKPSTVGSTTRPTIELADEQPQPLYDCDDSREWVQVRYATIKELRQRVRDAAHKGLAELFTNHIYVGLVDEHRRLAAVQHGVKLYLVDYAAIAYEMFYQIGLSDFRNFGVIRLTPPLKIQELLQIAAEQERQFEKAEREERRGNGVANALCCQIIEKLLLDKRVMLRDYFSVDINDEGELVSIPMLLKGYTPCLGKLPSFLLRLGPNRSFVIPLFVSILPRSDDDSESVGVME
ncbi:Similar to DNA mismatch repair protein Mlh1; acc. no. P40692 [Pyronema omphalodes CBS 100304]|uniref:Similar to DNA mismatch repair protein Mlh1 acc. no. P40692 n=1 Tax=Pyronema omphalodes (strain CBS 100304) TaxID=1076935 RepID=U4L512_PYROM|nr:Similar to DNA mismatch repair protein Mlh1; acc. no. P40692 [Pyronema omphalodes CBS 100304]